MWNQHELRTPGGYLEPQDLRQLSSHGRGYALLDRRDDPDRVDRLRKALGLPEPAHNRVALERHQIAYRKYQDQIFTWNGNTRELHPDTEFGKECFVIGWHGEQYDHDSRQYLPNGPVVLGRRVRYDGYEWPERPTSTLPIHDVKLVEWPERGGGMWGRHHYGALQGWDNANVVGLRLEHEGQLVWVYAGMDTAELVFGLHVNERGNLEVDGDEFGPFPSLASFVHDPYGDSRSGRFEFTQEDLGSLYHLHVGDRSLNNMLHAAARAGDYRSTDALKKPGLTKLYKEKLKPLGEELFAAREYKAWCAFRTLFRDGGKAVDKVKISVVVNHEFAEVSTVDELRAKLAVYQEGGVKAFDFFSAKRKEIVKRDTSKAIRKRVAELDEIEIDQDRYPLTYGALTDGSIPLTCIFPAGETYFLINDNWDLWEEMLAKFPEETRAIAQNAGARRQYERDVMSYFYLVLHALPEYLNRHTGYDWTCSPRLVESQYELEPEAVEEDRNVVKRRSALTPVADNRKCHVVVPYCSMVVYGRMTTYAYAHSYHLLERGMVFDGNVVSREVEEKLNGKDDYGLMFYTLTGSYTNRGYPTFLIIFERLRRAGKTRVHFHRVHPMRSKDGDRNPVSNWIRVSYKWMIGNVSSDDVEFQQGDLAFVRVSDARAEKIDFSGAADVTDCDSHCFTRPVKFVKYEGKKKHVLGHVRIDEKGLKLEHPEHDNVAAKTGVFEVRQARSWEANPKGIWTLNFD